jgi:hypothetical protein
VPAEALLAALATLTQMKGVPTGVPQPAAAAAATGATLTLTLTLTLALALALTLTLTLTLTLNLTLALTLTLASPFAAADPVFDYGPSFDVDKLVQVAATDDGDGDDDGDGGGDGGGAADDDAVAEALEEAIAALGYAADDAGRRELERILDAALGGSAPLPEGLRELVAGRTGLDAAAAQAALARTLPRALAAVRAVIAYQQVACGASSSNPIPDSSSPNPTP